MTLLAGYGMRTPHLLPSGAIVALLTADDARRGCLE
jgi:hypothetical protein